MKRDARALALAAALTLASCRAVVVPPRDVVDPVRVFVVDQGRHSALVLPRSDGTGHDLWAWGEWRWFALDDTDWWRLPAVLFWPTRAALGRAPWNGPPEADAIARAFWAEKVIGLDVERGAAAALESRLVARFEEARDERLYSTLYRLEFVPDDANSYSVLHHCNDRTRTWLRELGCDVWGTPLIANFVTEDEAARSGRRGRRLARIAP
ncbi:MAG: hypothetical protein R3F34_03715 [Planctomycetota bacterium]